MPTYSAFRLCTRHLQALQQAICDGPGTAAPAIVTALTSPDTSQGASSGAARAVVHSWDACCEAAARAVSGAAEQNMEAFPAGGWAGQPVCGHALLRV